MTGNSFVDAKRMFKHACAFADCAVVCFKDKNNLIVRTQWYSTPGIVNSAFACEVFIKALLVYHGMTLDQIKPIGHRLENLWNAHTIHRHHLLQVQYPLPGLITSAHFVPSL